MTQYHSDGTYSLETHDKDRSIILNGNHYPRWSAQSKTQVLMALSTVTPTSDAKKEIQQTTLT